MLTFISALQKPTLTNDYDVLYYLPKGHLLSINTSPQARTQCPALAPPSLRLTQVWRDLTLLPCVTMLQLRPCLRRHLTRTLPLHPTAVSTSAHTWPPRPPLSRQCPWAQLYIARRQRTQRLPPLRHPALRAVVRIHALMPPRPAPPQQQTALALLLALQTTSRFPLALYPLPTFPPGPA